MTRLLYKISDAAELLSMGRTKFYAELSSGRIESVTVGRSRLIPAEALEAFVELLRNERSGTLS